MTNKTDVIIVNNELAAGRQAISASRPRASALLTALALGLMMSVAALGQANAPRDPAPAEAASRNVNPVLEWNQIFIDTLIAANTPNSSSQRLGAIAWPSAATDVISPSASAANRAEARGLEAEIACLPAASSLFTIFTSVLFVIAFPF